jgi:hypothetical protein
MKAGVAAEFVEADTLLVAIAKLRERGYRALDAYAPHPVPGLEDALELGRSRLNWLVFPIGIGGAVFAFLLQAWCNAVDYPINVGGRPPFSWPSNIPITFETGILATATVGFVALLWVLGLPNLTHPLFKLDGFERASIDRFWLTIEAGDAKLDAARTPEELRLLGAARVMRFGPQEPAGVAQ